MIVLWILVFHFVVENFIWSILFILKRLPVVGDLETIARWEDLDEETETLDYEMGLSDTGSRKFNCNEPGPSDFNDSRQQRSKKQPNWMDDFEVGLSG